MKRYAILIGAEEYEDFSETQYCHNDVDALFEVLTKKCDYAEQDVLAFKLTITESVSPRDILGKIDELLDRSTDGDSILFFYAGHGEAIKNESYLILPGTKAVNKEGTALPFRDVHHYLSKNKRLNIRVFDTCHSGQDLRSPGDDLDADGFTKNILEQGADSSITFASCSIHEKSYPDPEVKCGVFTHAFVQALEESEVDKPVRPEILKVSVCDKVEQWCVANNKVQTPTYSAHIHGNVTIATRKREPPKVQPEVVESEKRTLEERLNAVRQVGIIGPNEYPTLTKGITDFHETICVASKKADCLGAELKFEAPLRSNEAKEFLNQGIVTRMRGEQSLHDLGSYTEEGYLSDIDRMLGRKAKVYTTYYVSQSYKQPKSFISGEIVTDGFIPYCGLFFYLCPLQASIAAIYGTYFDVSYFGASSDVRVQPMSSSIFSIHQIQQGQHLSICQPLLDTFSTELHGKVEARIKNLELEAKKRK